MRNVLLVNTVAEKTCTFYFISDNVYLFFIVLLILLLLFLSTIITPKNINWNKIKYKNKENIYKK